MDIPNIRGKKIEETQSEPAQDSATESTTSAGIAAEGDSIEKAEGEAYFNVDGWVDLNESEIHSGLGASEEKQALILGAVERAKFQSGAAIRIGYRIPGATVGGKEVDVDMNLTGTLFFDRRYGYAMEASLGKDSHIELGLNSFAGILLGLAGALNLGDIFQMHLDLQGGVGVGWISNLNMGVKDGVFSADINLGIGAGLAGVIDYGISINVLQGAEVAVTQLKEWFTDLGDFAKQNFPGEITGGILLSNPDTAEGIADWLSDSFQW